MNNARTPDNAPSDRQHQVEQAPGESRATPESLEGRISRLEAQLAWMTATVCPRPRTHTAPYHPAVPLALSAVVLAFGYLGLGLPQHYYQPLFAGLVLALAYHRGFWVLPPGRWRWPQVSLNFLVLTLFFKLLIGGGTSYPLDWLRVPTIKKVSPDQPIPWYDQIIPDFDIAWESIPALTDISFDITMVQTFLLLATLGGAVFRFQPFASLTAVVLLLVSIPTFIGFNWEWVVLFLVIGGMSLYLQTASNEPRAPGGVE